MTDEIKQKYSYLFPSAEEERKLMQEQAEQTIANMKVVGLCSPEKEAAIRRAASEAPLAMSDPKGQDTMVQLLTRLDQSGLIHATKSRDENMVNSQPKTLGEIIEFVQKIIAAFTGMAKDQLGQNPQAVGERQNGTGVGSPGSN